MTSKEKIINSIRDIKLSVEDLPEFSFTESINGDLIMFKKMLIASGGKIHISDMQGLKTFYQSQKDKGLNLMNRISGLDAVDETCLHKTPFELENTDVCFIKGEIGVSENGAVWIPEKNMGNRLLPFICKHLVLLIHKHKIVGNMHDAYDAIQSFNEGYGVFIAGPSKTADIEQSLVIGAHGALNTTVFVI